MAGALGMAIAIIPIILLNFQDGDTQMARQIVVYMIETLAPPAAVVGFLMAAFIAFAQKQT